MYNWEDEGGKKTGRRERGREGGREGEEKEGSLNEISVLTPLCS